MLIPTTLLKWYKKHGRDLPWRHTDNPYKILVSEIMLQQTQVDRVRLFYQAWLKQFPDWKTLAKASNKDVIRAWAGLGYNRRALMLRDAAKQVVQNGLPHTKEAWQSIKGIGPYTAAAISVFAQKQRHLPIDTNIRRVLGRLLLNKPFVQQKDDEKLQSMCDVILPKSGNFYDVPQAIFDLATMVCTKSPTCSVCPFKSVCPMSNKFLSGAVRIPKQSINRAKETKHRNKPYPDRIYRGRILKQVRESKTGVRHHTLGPLIDPTFDKNLDTQWFMAMIDRLIKDELIEQKQKRLLLKS